MVIFTWFILTVTLIKYDNWNCYGFRYIKWTSGGQWQWQWIHAQSLSTAKYLKQTFSKCAPALYCQIHTHYHKSNLIWRTVSRRVDEVIPSDHPGRIASRVFQWYGLIHETWYCTPDQVTFMIICLLYAFFSDILSAFKTCFGL